MRYSESKIDIWESDRYMVEMDTMGCDYDGPRDLALDLGAHVGTRSIWLATDGQFKRVYAVEAELDNFILLKRNIDKNGLREHIVPIFTAVSNRSELLAIMEGHCNRGQFSLAFDVLGMNSRAVVATIPLERLIKSILQIEDAKEINFLKMDIEGGEYMVFSSHWPHQSLPGACDSINSFVRYLYLERHGPNKDYFSDEFFIRNGFNPKDPQKRLFEMLGYCGFHDIKENSIGQLMMYNSNFKQSKAA